MISTKEIAWLAGLLEGEGSFDRQFSASPRQIRVQVGMTDRDVIEHVANLWKGTCGGPYQPKRWTKKGELVKASYRTNVHGKHAAAWMMTLYPLMGKRRKATIRKLLCGWRTSLARRYAECHPERLHAGLGMCESCYQKHYRRRRKHENRLC